MKLKKKTVKEGVISSVWKQDGSSTWVHTHNLEEVPIEVKRMVAETMLRELGIDIHILRTKADK